MKKILSLIAIIAAQNAFAYFDYTNFAPFDNQVSFGLNTQNGKLDAGQDNVPYSYAATSINLEIEKLFNFGLWLNVNTGAIQTYTQSKINDDNNGSPLGAYPLVQTLNAKLGYNLALTPQFGVVPYLLVGKNANLPYYTSLAGSPGFDSAAGTNITEDYFYTLGGGIRLEYPINKIVAVYFDQLLARNLDQTNYTYTPNDSEAQQTVTGSNTQWTSTLGVKVNVIPQLQLGANLFYTNYVGYDSYSSNVYHQSGLAFPTTAYGGQVSVGFTFN